LIYQLVTKVKGSEVPGEIKKAAPKRAARINLRHFTEPFESLRALCEIEGNKWSFKKVGLNLPL
jgi:hypothetical protein